MWTLRRQLSAALSAAKAQSQKLFSSPSVTSPSTSAASPDLKNIAQPCDDQRLTALGANMTAPKDFDTFFFTFTAPIGRTAVCKITGSWYIIPTAFEPAMRRRKENGAATAADSAVPAEAFTVRPSHNKTTSSASSSISAPNHFLRLSAELRNEIYELAFTGDAQPDLTTATPPSSALLATNKQICAEASGLFRSAQQTFYREDQFELCISVEDGQNTIAALNPQTIQHIHHLHLRVFKDEPLLIFGLVDADSESEICNFSMIRLAASSPRAWMVTRPDTRLKYNNLRVRYLDPSKSDHVYTAPFDPAQDGEASREMGCLQPTSLDADDDSWDEESAEDQGFLTEEPPPHDQLLYFLEFSRKIIELRS